MKKKIRPLFVTLVFSMAVFACSPVTPTVLPASATFPVTIEPTSAATASSQIPSNEADVPRVSVQDAAAAIKNGDAVVVDVRSAQAYQASHIPGAISIPLFDIETDPTGLNLDKDKWIITYCT